MRPILPGRQGQQPRGMVPSATGPLVVDPALVSSRYVNPGIDPAIRRFAKGGTVPGPKGKPVLVVAHGGETITPPRKKKSKARRRMEAMERFKRLHG